MQKKLFKKENRHNPLPANYNPFPRVMHRDVQHHYNIDCIILERGYIVTNEELVLLIQHCDNKKENLEMLYHQNHRMIVAIAKKYSGLFEFDDLMQEAYFGLSEAAHTYNPEGDTKFSTYATECIRYHLLNYLRDHGCSVKLSAKLQEKIRKLNKVIDDYIKKYAHEPSMKELAKIMNISIKQAEELSSYSNIANVKSLNELVSAENDLLELGDTIPDPFNQFDDADEKMQNEQLKKVLWPIVDGLSKQQSEVIRKRYINRETGQQIADSMGCTVGNVKTIEHHAMKELRKNHATKQLRPFLSDDKIFSISLQYSGYRRFIHTWTSAPEKAALLAEMMQR